MILSIIIPCYNAEPYIEHLIQRLKPQINDEMEVLVVDDGSDFPYLAPYDWVKVVRQKNKGLAGARNTGIKHTTGKYIAFIDADDLVSENFVQYVQSRADEDWDYMDLSWKSLESNKYVYKLRNDKDKLSNPSVCTKVWRRAFIGDLRFNEKKDVAEDEDFTRRINLSRGKRVCAPDFMYFYRLNTPNSLSKQYRNGETATKRIVYYFRHLPTDDALLEEIKEASECNEVVILSEDTDPELSKYSNIVRPIGTWADEARGEPTSLIKVREKPYTTQIIIYTDNTYTIGGIETFIYNFCKTMNKHYDITVLYGSNMAPEQISRLLPMVAVMRLNKGKKYVCDTLIINRVFDKAPENIKRKQTIQMVHGCKAANPWHIPSDKGKIVCVSEAVKKSFGEETENATVINNLVDTTKSKDVLFLVSASRFDTPEKGQHRMVKLAEMMKSANIPFIWMYFSNRAIPKAPEGMVKMDPTLDIRKYIRKADYLVQLSDTEAFCYSVVESLIEGTPVITTPLPVLSELKVEDGKNAHIIPFDMDYDVEKLLDIPSFKYTYNNGTLVSKWKKILGNTKPTHSYVPDLMCKVRVLTNYFDTELGRAVSKGETLEMRRERANKAQAIGLVLIKEG